ncbi:UNVERIFIED_CONTAM: hypothetical protein Slati_2163000 [Sesamum latifolium]|uniref:Uncharacterized protein n=1 Tax=Sesamum latifolium TaxID=2727402 RepID=A0AAW2WS91_9LAMI
MRGVLSSNDRQLLVPLSQEELEGVASSFLLKGVPPVPQSEAQWRKLEDKADRLNADVVRLKEEKKELLTRAQQQEKELKKLKKEVVGHEEAIRKAVEKAELVFPNSEDSQHFLKGYWADRISAFKKSEDYQAEVATIARPYFEHDFMACKEQFLAQGYPPDGEEPTFLDLGAAMENAPNPFIGSSAPAEEDLPHNSDVLPFCLLFF